RNADTAVVGRNDVRIPDADALCARFRRIAPRPELSGRSRPADRVWATATRPVGHFRIGFRRAGREFRLSLPVVRRPGPGFEARIGKRPGHFALLDGT